MARTPEEVIQQADQRINGLLDRITGTIASTLQVLRTREPRRGIEAEFEPGADALLDDLIKEAQDKSR